MALRIIPATLRDLSYIAANLRPEDRAEIDCQLDDWSPTTLALVALQGFAYVAELDGNPNPPHSRRQGMRPARSRHSLAGRCQEM